MKRLAVLALMCVACVRPAPRVTVDSAFTPKEEGAIQLAAAKWNTIARVPVDVRVNPGEGQWALIKDCTPEMVAKGFVGLTDYPGRLIRIKPGLDEAMFYATVLHELGHAQGLHHIAGPGVMNPNVGTIEFSAGDIEECQTQNVCGYDPITAAKLRMQGVIQ